jgi:hypothetical protein
LRSKGLPKLYINKLNAGFFTVIFSFVMSATAFVAHCIFQCGPSPQNIYHPCSSSNPKEMKIHLGYFCLGSVHVPKHRIINVHLKSETAALGFLET